VLAPLKAGQIWLSRDQDWRLKVDTNPWPDGRIQCRWFHTDGMRLANLTYRWVPSPDGSYYRFDDLGTTDPQRLDLITLIYNPEG
jgi:hypothetical protein